MDYVRHGFGAVRPYVYGYPDLLALVCSAFDGVVLERDEMPAGVHVEVRIADAALVLELCDPPHASGHPNSIYVYVPDVDAAYARGLAAGASSVSAPDDKPYGERSCGLRDRFGNTWWISTLIATAR